MRTKSILALGFFLLSLALWGREIVIALGVPEDSPLYGYWTNLFNEVSRQSDGEINIQLKSMSLARCRKSLLDGTVDGDAGRTELVYEGERDVIKIDIPLFTNRYYAYAKAGLDFSSPEKRDKYRLVTITGNFIANRYVEENNLDTIFVNENEEGLRMILYNRVDYLIATDLESSMLEKNEFKNKYIIMHPQEIFNKKIYLFLSERNRALVPLLEKILSEMDKKGILEKYLTGNIH